MRSDLAVDTDGVIGPSARPFGVADPATGDTPQADPD